jgi:hypothetical protein
MSWVEGEKLSESSAEDVQRLCSLLLNCYLIQLLETGFLHADPVRARCCVGLLLHDLVAACMVAGCQGPGVSAQSGRCLCDTCA